MSIRTKLSSQFLAGGFIFVLFVPLLVMLSGHQAEISGREKRRLAVKPEFTIHALWNGEFQREYDGYFRDHFGLRSEVLSAARWSREVLFNKSISDRVIVGREGWRFYNIDGSLRDFIGEYDPTERQLREWVRGLKLKQSWLKSFGVNYLLVPIPGKMSIYPEYLPERIQKISGVTRLMAFRKYLSELPEEKFVVDAYGVLSKARAKRQLYFRTDTHWNDDGAYRVYAAVMRQLKKWYPELDSVPLSDYKRKPKAKKGDIAQASGLPLTFTEPAEELYLADPCAGENYKELSEFAYTQAYREVPKRLPQTNGCYLRRLKAIVIHDSFGHFLKQFLNESFKEVVYMPSYDLFGMRSFIKKYRPDVLVDFRVDRRFHLLLEPDSRIETVLDLKTE